jgi:large subunit ribosomal protein L32
MTPLPKRRHSTMRQGKRRATHILKLANIIACPNCKQPTRPHNACSSCGFYRGKKVTK